MAETTGLLNRRTGYTVPRVRISSSPLPNKQITLSEYFRRGFLIFQPEKIAPDVQPRLICDVFTAFRAALVAGYKSGSLNCFSIKKQYLWW